MPTRGVAAMMALSVLAWPMEGVGRDTSDYRTTTSTNDGQPKGGGGKHGGWLEVLVPIVIVGGLACAAACGKKSESPTSKALLSDGPVMPEGQPFGTFAIYGFVRDGWPIVVDYPRMPPGVSATLTITLGKKSWSTPIEGGDQPSKLIYDGGGASEATPALFTVEAFSRNPDGSKTPQNVELVGIGCGPAAVGSITINSVTFRTSARQVGGDYARFGYVASNFFNQSEQEVLRYAGMTDPKTKAEVITVTPVARFRTPSRPPGRYGDGVWDGLEQKSRKQAAGPHRLRVRAWETDRDSSWVASISRDVVWAP